MMNFLKNDLKPKYYTILLMIMLSLILFSKLIYNGLPNFDDCYYAEKAKEIITTGDIWTLKFNNKPEFENPPMHMWIIAGMYKIFGINEYAARFSSALFTVFLIYIVFLIGTLIFNEWAGFFSSFVLSTTFFLTKYSFRAMTDITLTFFIAVSFLFFILGIKKNENYFLLSGLFIGFAILTKSIFGVFFLGIMVLFLIIERRWDKLFSVKFILAGLIALIVASPWYLINYFRYKNKFLKYHFVWIFKNQVFTGGTKSFKDYLGALKVIFSFGLPWVPMAIYGSIILIKKRIKSQKFQLWLVPVLWAWILVIFLSFADQRKSWHLMPTFIASSIICGYLLQNWIKNNIKFAKIVTSVYFIVMMIIVILPIDLNSRKSNELKKIIPIIKKIVPPGQNVINFKQDYWGNTCYFTYYTDRHLTRPIHNAKKLIKKLKNTHVLGYSHRQDFQRHLSKYSQEIKIIGYFGKNVIFCHKDIWDKIDILFDIPKDMK